MVEACKQTSISKSIVPFCEQLEKVNNQMQGKKLHIITIFSLLLCLDQKCFL